MAEDASAALAAEVEPGDGLVIVRVRGEFDLAGVEVFSSAIGQAGETGAPDADGLVIELDLTDVTFIDSSGVGAIVVASRSVAAAGGTITIGARSSVVERVLEVSGVEDALRSAGTD
jgi:anti-anti-sigma factor